MKLSRLAMVIATSAALWVATGTAFAANDTEGTKEAPKDIVLKGDAKCTTCHDENDSPQALKIGKTKHGVGADQRTPTCTNCHGESETHQKEAGRGSGPTPPVEVNFGAKSKNTTAQKNDACLACHQGGKRIHWQSGVHANRDVSCTSCHSIHTQEDKVRAKETQPEVCYACHKEQRAQVQRPSHHPIPEGKMACTSCHDVHGDNPKMMTRAVTNDTCYTCHMEKRGPFVHNHAPVTEDCAICHNPHGTVTPSLLKARMPFLCQQCHNHTSHPSQSATLPAGRTSSTSLLGAVGRGCTNCHTNIHGSNSTENRATAGRFRR